jgi:hypothetical protein
MSTRMTPSSLVLLVKPCEVCGMGPCACSYVAKLRPEGSLSHLRDAALLNFGRPLPHLDADAPGDNRRTSGSCPCPRCFSVRLASLS